MRGGGGNSCPPLGAKRFGPDLRSNEVVASRQVIERETRVTVEGVFPGTWSHRRADDAADAPPPPAPPRTPPPGAAARQDRLQRARCRVVCGVALACGVALTCGVVLGGRRPRRLRSRPSAPAPRLAGTPREETRETKTLALSSRRAGRLPSTNPPPPLPLLLRSPSGDP
jgi:hypothetical protein